MAHKLSVKIGAMAVKWVFCYYAHGLLRARVLDVKPFGVEHQPARTLLHIRGCVEAVSYYTVPYSCHMEPQLVCSG